MDRCVNVAAGNAAGCLGAAMSYRWCYRLAKGRMRPQPIPSFQRDVEEDVVVSRRPFKRSLNKWHLYLTFPLFSLLSSLSSLGLISFLVEREKITSVTSSSASFLSSSFSPNPVSVRRIGEEHQREMDDLLFIDEIKLRISNVFKRAENQIRLTVDCTGTVVTQLVA